MQHLLQQADALDVLQMSSAGKRAEAKTIQDEIVASQKFQNDLALTNARANARAAALNSPEAIAAAGQRAGTESAARTNIENQNTLVPSTLPDGTVQMTTKAAALAAAQAGKPITSALPGFITSGQGNLLAKLNDGTAAYQERQTIAEPLDALAKLQESYQTGANSTEFNNAVAQLKSFGIIVPNSATLNSGAMQQFAKNAYTNVLASMRAQGNKQYAAEVQSAVNSNPNPDLQPEANAAMIAQMKGIQQYHDKNFEEFSNWYNDPNNKGATNDAQFQIGWAKAHPVQPFIDAARKEIAPLGIAVPAPAQRTVGQRYNIPGKGVFRWQGSGWSAQ